jgi:hypothetical protein
MVYYDDLYGGVLQGDGNSGGGGTSYVAGDGIAIKGNTISATGGGGGGTVTGIEASVSGNTATVTATGSTTSVNLVGTDGVLVQGNTNGEVEFGVPAVSKHAVFSNSAATLAANTELVAVENCDNMKNDYITFFANFETFGTLTISHLLSTYGYGKKIVITATEIGVYDRQDQLTISYQHGLTLSDFVYVLIQTKNTNLRRSDIVLKTNGGSFTVPQSFFYGDIGPVKAVATAAMTNASLNYVVTDAVCPVWVFGDSYIDFMANTASWAYQFIANKHTGVLFCGHSGANVDDQWLSFQSLVSKAIPRFVVWGLGMNNGDSSSAINSDWKTVADSLISTCEALGITLIFCTIPNTPTHNNTFKNAYIKASGLRYVDFAHAVNADAANATWYTGMLSSDNTHPTELGAITLMSRFIQDCPEAVLLEDNQLPIAAGDRIELINGSTITQAAWNPITTVTSNYVQLRPGNAYIASATSSNFSLYPPYPYPDGKYGLESHLEIFVGKTSYVIAQSGVVLVNALQPDSVNNCLIRFHDGKVLVSVEDHIAGYVVVSATGSASGSLPYGLTSSTQEYVVFDISTDGGVCNTSGVVTNGKKHLVGNGVSNTTITGGMSCTNETTLVNLTLSGGAIVADSSLVFDSGHYAPDTVSGAGLLTISSGAIIDLTGNINATPINPGGGVLFPEDGATIYPSAGSASAIFIGGGAFNAANPLKFNAITSGGHLMLSSGTKLYKDLLGSNAVIESGGFQYYGHSSSILVSGITFSSSTNGNNTFNANANSCVLTFQSVSFVNSVDTQNAYVKYGGTLVIQDCSFDKPARILSASAEVKGNNTIVRLFGTATDSIRISSGASIALTSSIEGAITVLDGGCVVNGTSLGSAGGSTTYTKITSVGGSASGTLA